MITRSSRGLVVAALLAAAMLRPAGATQVRKMDWQELVLGADMVAEVECTVAGGIVAKYRIVAIWKGQERVGQELRLKISPNTWEPQFPLALVGERYIVAAYRTPPSIMLSTTIGGAVPLWWRDLDAAYRTPLFQGMTRLQGAENGPCKVFDQEFESVAAFGKAAQTLLREPEAVKEKMLLDAALGGYRESDKAAMWEAVKAVDEVKTVGEAVPALKKLGTPEAASLVEVVERILAERKAASQPRPAEAPQVAQAPTQAEIEAAKKALPAAEDYAFSKAFELLTKESPGTVMDYLLTWENPRKRWSDAYQGYVLGSYFGHKCPAEGRVALLKRLTEAKDPEIRVAAAVYWAFDDLPGATAKLRELSKLEGDPGAWAAMTLARRGDKEALPRAMEIFKTPGEGQMAGVPHRNFQKQMLVLLSNSAAASGISQPPAKTDEEGAFVGVDEWYRQNGAKLKLVDAWAEELAKKRAD